MKEILFLFLLCFCSININGQKIDADFGRNGLFLFKELHMVSSNVVDFDLLEDNTINALVSSNGHGHLIRLHTKGIYDTTFDTSSRHLKIDRTSIVAIHTKQDGSILVLSNEWRGRKWIITIRGYLEDGAIDESFGNNGTYQKDVAENRDNNFGRYMYVSSEGEIMVVAEISRFGMVKKTEKVAVLKVSEWGTTLSTEFYDESQFSLDCAAMQGDQLFVGYSESLNNETELATYIVKSNSHDLNTSRFTCLYMDSGYQNFDNLVVSNTNLYASNIRSNLGNLYLLHKYDSSGNLDESYVDTGEIDFNADIHNTDFVVNDSGEVFVISISHNNSQEIFIKKLLANGQVDASFGSDGMATLFLNYPITSLSKVQLNSRGDVYISGSMNVRGDGIFGFIAKINLNTQVLKKEKLSKFLDQLFRTNE